MELESYFDDSSFGISARIALVAFAHLLNVSCMGVDKIIINTLSKTGVYKPKTACNVNYDDTELCVTNTVLGPIITGNTIVLKKTVIFKINFAERFISLHRRGYDAAHFNFYLDDGQVIKKDFPKTNDSRLLKVIRAIQKMITINNENK